MENICSENFSRKHSWRGPISRLVTELKLDSTAVASPGIVQNLWNIHSVTCEQLLP